MSINFGCFSIDVVDSISRLCNCIATHKDYVCNLKENIDILRTEKEGLTALKKDVMRMVDIAEVRLQLERLERLERLDTAQHWLTRVEGMEAEVDQLIADASQEIEKNCLGGCCPKNCPSTYKQGKNVAEKIKQVINLKGEGNFPEVAGEQLLPLGSEAERPSRRTVGLESAFNKARSYIGDEGVGIISIYGMGGVGKTALLTKINNEFCANFDRVIWLVVSKNSTIGKVQDGIAEKLGIQSQGDKAAGIFEVLKRKRFVLLLDDIWEQIDLVEVGVPVPNRYNKSKVVFTTRFEDVCGRMGTQKKIKVACLVREKAWDLFRENVGEAALNSEIHELAESVADECKGLPLALITIGRAMACKKTPQEWQNALAVLKKNAAEFSGMEDRVLRILKFSYDNLRSEEQSCFLYCSLFPEDYLISKERLIEYWIGEGLLDGFNDLNKGYDIIGTLIHARLLEEVSYDSALTVFAAVPDMSDKVKMHGVIHDMALWIASKCGEVEDNFLVQAGNKLEKPPHIGKWKDVERMSLMQNEIEELIETPPCPDLSTLFLSGNELKMITPNFFQNMANLKVLDLSRNSSLEVLPVEISGLVSLQYLNLSWTVIEKLPIEYKNLVNLKYLNLDFTDSSDIIPLGLLSSFKKLEVLKIFRIFSSLLFDKDSDFEAFLREVEGLKDLNQFSLSITTISTLSLMLRSPKILSCTNLLGLSSMKGLKSLDLSFLQSMRGLQHLVFRFCKDLEDLKVETTREEEANSDVIISRAYCFQSLRSICIWGSEKLKEVTWLRFAPNLEFLKISSCNGMKEVICHGKYGEASAPEEGGGYLKLFAKLKDLYLANLPQLKSIYPNAQSFPCLKFLRVIKCPNLKKFPLNSDSARGCLVEIEGEREWWNELEWEDEATQNAFLPFFEEFHL